MDLTPKRSDESATEMVQVVLPNDAKSLLAAVRSPDAHLTAELYLAEIDGVWDHTRASASGNPITQITQCGGQR